MIKGIHHISIIASSEKTIEFFANLGFRETFRQERPYDSIVFLDGYGMRLVIFVDPSHPQRDTNPEQLGIRYFALQVDNVEELAKRCGGATLKKDWNGEQYFVLKDPDGLLIQFHE